MRCYDTKILLHQAAPGGISSLKKIIIKDYLENKITLNGCHFEDLHHTEEIYPMDLLTCIVHDNKLPSFSEGFAEI